jgi:serine/threonine protein kinase
MNLAHSTTVAPLDAPLLLGRYQPQSLLARGGSSLVYRGLDQTLARDVAIKVFSAGVDLARYNDELRLLASLSHHGVVSIVDAGMDSSTPTDPRPFLVMELIQGKTVRDTLKQRSLSVREIGEIGYEVAEALDYVHTRGVIHRDITPSNIMLTDYGSVSSRSRARITDFGIAVDATYTPSETDQVTGTAAYVSPEQVKNVPLTAATDIYSLGLVMLECFTEVRAFPGEVVESALARITKDPEIPRSIDKPWRHLLAQMTQREPFDRPSAAEVAQAVRALLRKSHS